MLEVIGDHAKIRAEASNGDSDELLHVPLDAFGDALERVTGRNPETDRSSRPRSYEGNGFEPATEEQLDLADRIANRWGAA